MDVFDTFCIQILYTKRTERRNCDLSCVGPLYIRLHITFSSSQVVERAQRSTCLPALMVSWKDKSGNVFPNNSKNIF